MFYKLGVGRKGFCCQSLNKLIYSVEIFLSGLFLLLCFYSFELINQFQHLMIDLTNSYSDFRLCKRTRWCLTFCLFMLTFQLKSSFKPPKFNSSKLQLLVFLSCCMLKNFFPPFISDRIPFWFFFLFLLFVKHGSGEIWTLLNVGRISATWIYL